MDEREAITIDGRKETYAKSLKEKASIGVGPSNKKLKAGGSRNGYSLASHPVPK